MGAVAWRSGCAGGVGGTFGVGFGRLLAGRRSLGEPGSGFVEGDVVPFGGGFALEPVDDGLFHVGFADSDTLGFALGFAVGFANGDAFGDDVFVDLGGEEDHGVNHLREDGQGQGAGGGDGPRWQWRVWFYSGNQATLCQVRFHS